MHYELLLQKSHLLSQGDGNILTHYRTKGQQLSPWELVMFSAAFDKLVYGEGKYYQIPRAS
jgi:hypothetical protein